MPDVYPDRSVFPVARPGVNDPNQAFDLAVIQFEDDGTFIDPAQLPRAAEAITAAHRHHGTGAIVVAFMHGWRHGAEWTDRATPGTRTSGRSAMC